MEKTLEKLTSEIRCKYCSGVWFLASGEGGKLAVVHSMPYCNEFLTMEGEEFIYSHPKP